MEEQNREGAGSSNPSEPGMGGFHGMLGCSPGMKSVYERIERFADASVPVLILGETGTGKEMVARALVRLAGPDRPLVVANCAAIPETLMESTLFGHERGAFTGAARRHTGLLAQANGGVLFLDEIGELSLSMQAKLLRALEGGEYRPVGGERILRSRFRLVAATNRCLEDMVSQDCFRLDLLHRIGSARISLPPLRDRPGDLEILAKEFLLRSRVTRGGRGPCRISVAGLALLRMSAWPGNVRELKNVVETAALFAPGPVLEVDHLVEFLSPPGPASEPEPRVRPLAEIVREAERNAIRDALRCARGDMDEAARLLGISSSTLYRRLARQEGDGPGSPAPDMGGLEAA